MNLEQKKYKTMTDKKEKKQFDIYCEEKAHYYEKLAEYHRLASELDQTYIHLEGAYPEHFRDLYEQEQYWNLDRANKRLSRTTESLDEYRKITQGPQVAEKVEQVNNLREILKSKRHQYSEDL